jgi:hypothetical protein
MFFSKGQSIELSKTKESEGRRKIEGNRVASVGNLLESQNAIINEQNRLMEDRSTINLGYRKSRSRLLHENKMDRLHAIDKAARQEIGRTIGEIVHESLWIDSDYKKKCHKAIVETTSNLVVSMFESGQLNYKMFADNVAPAVRTILEAAKEVAQTKIPEDESDENIAKYASDEKDNGTTEDDDSDDMGKSSRESARKSAAVEAITTKTKEYVLNALAAEREIAEQNVARAKEIHNEGTRLVRPRRESPTLWRSINVNIGKILGEGAEVEKITAESLAVYTFLEAMSIMNLINPSQENINALCRKLTNA